MNRMRAIALTALSLLPLSATVTQAGVYVGIGVPGPYYRPYYRPYYGPRVIVAPPPVYVGPAPAIYVAPPPAPVYVQSAPTVLQAAPVQAVAPPPVAAPGN